MDFSWIPQTLTALAAVLAAITALRTHVLTKDTNSMINGGVERDLMIGSTAAKSLFLLSATEGNKKLMDDAQGRLEDHQRKMLGAVSNPKPATAPPNPAVANKAQGDTVSHE